MNNPSEFNRLYKDSSTKEDDLKAVLELLEKTPDLLEDMIYNYLRDTVEAYIGLKGDVKCMEMITAFATSVPNIFGSVTRIALSSFSLPTDDSSVDETKREAVEWFSRFHPEAYEDFEAEKAEMDAQLCSSAEQEKIENFFKLIRHLPDE